MDTNQQHYHYTDKSGDYMEWDNQPFPYSFSADYLSELPSSSPNMPTNTNDSSLNDEFMQYLHHPYISEVSPSSHHQQQQQQPSPIVEEEEDDDDDSLDCSIATPHQFYFPSFDLSKDSGAAFFSYHSQNQRILQQQQYTKKKDNMISMTPSSSSSKSSISSSSSSSLPSNLLDDYASAIPRSYVSLSDVNAFVAKADSIKNSASVQKSIATLNHQNHPLSSPSWSAAWENTEFQSPTFSSPSSPYESGSSSSISSSPSSSTTFQNDKLTIKLPKYHSTPAVNTTNVFSTMVPSTSFDSFMSSEAKQDLHIELEDVTDMYQQDEEDERDDEDDEDEVIDDDDDDESDDDYEYARPSHHHSASTTHFHNKHTGGTFGHNTIKRHHKTKKQKSLAIKKGRNVDKACNHCKRSHLRCDDMRPCRRCISTGKIGCKDVQHKPRGRPKLHKK